MDSKAKIFKYPEYIDVVVDMQNDFVTGALGTKEAQLIVPTVIQTVKATASEGNGLIFTKDTHTSEYLSSREGKELPVPHCIYGTPGWELIPELEEISLALNRRYELNKPTFGAIMLPEFIEKMYGNAIKQGFIKKFRVYGVCTGICVISNATILRAAFPEIDIEIIENCCACVTPESHMNAIQAMKMLQMHVI